MLHTVSQESEYVEYESLFDLQFYGEQTGQEQLPSIKSSQEQIPTPPVKSFHDSVRVIDMFT